MPQIFFDVRGTRGGYHQGGEIHYNDKLASENFDEYLTQVIPHETAHYIQRKLYPRSKAHGPEWKNIMRILEVRVERCHSMDIESVRVRHVQKFEATCNCQTHQLTKRKVEIISRLKCTRCKSGLKMKVIPKIDFAAIALIEGDYD